MCCESSVCTSALPFDKPSASASCIAWLGLGVGVGVGVGAGAGVGVGVGFGWQASLLSKPGLTYYGLT